MIYCFGCMNPIRGQPYEMKVSRDFCHSSYWDKNGKQYGRVSRKPYGILFLHQREANAASESYGNPLGEGYEECEDCGAVFSDLDMSVKVYEEMGMLCPRCAVQGVLDNLKKFVRKDIPHGQLPNLHIGRGLPHKLPHGVKEYKSEVGSASWSLAPSVDIESLSQGIKEIIEHGNAWMLLTESMSWEERVVEAKLLEVSTQ